MKVLIILDKDPYKFLNPFVYTLIDGIKSQFNDFEWNWGVDIFWTDECLDYNIIHIQWPNLFEMTMDGQFTSRDFVERILYLKSKGVKIVTTCHNLTPHYSSSNLGDELYSLSYLYSDYIIHLGKYSLQLFQQMYPKSKNVLIPHHIYDTVYTKTINKEECLAKLRLDTNKKYILCFGAFRNKEERRLIIKLSKMLRLQNISILAPSFYSVIFRKTNWKRYPAKYLLSYTIRRILYIVYKLKYRNIYFERKEIEDDRLLYFYGACDIALIHRTKILNSGNVPLAFLMKKVVVGPDTGNVGTLLKEMGNPMFDCNDLSTLYVAVEKALELEQNTNLGVFNYNFAMQEFNTEKTSKALYKLYKEMLCQV